jgi:hypothetical protein
VQNTETESIGAIYIRSENLQYLSKQEAQMLLSITGKLYALVDASLADKLAEVAGYKECA